MTAITTRPRQSWAGLFNISFGFLGIQIGFALQNANISRIFSRSAPASTICPRYGSPRR